MRTVLPWEGLYQSRGLRSGTGDTWSDVQAVSFSSSVEVCAVRSVSGFLAMIEVSLTEKRTKPVMRRPRLVQVATWM